MFQAGKGFNAKVSVKKDKKIMMSDLISKLTKLTQHTERQVAVVLTYSPARTYARENSESFIPQQGYPLDQWLREFC